tara:strand:- start:12447 stop:13028 length:582 start_codon:yes stop_codon:yes gene_type:complete
MIEFSEFNITNVTGSLVIISSLDTFNLPSGSVRDVFSSESGSFSMADVVNNTEIENLLQSGSISIADENGGVVQTTTPLYGHVYTVIQPAAISTTQNNYNPDGWYNSKLIYIQPDTTTRYISGFQKTYHGDFKVIFNNSVYSLGLLHNSSNSLAENRILPSELTTFNLKKNSSAIIYYDSIVSKWRTLSDEKP